MLRISSADAIIGYEIGWRKEGGAVAKKVEEYQEKITELDKNYETKGRLAKFFGKRKYEKRRDLLLNSIRDVKMRFRRNYSDKMEKELAISYDDSGSYGFDYDKLKFASEERSSKNEEYNRRFFGLDDPARMTKVERAILLRQKYKDEWAKEVKKHKFTMAFEGKY